MENHLRNGASQYTSSKGNRMENQPQSPQFWAYYSELWHPRIQLKQ